MVNLEIKARDEDPARTCDTYFAGARGRLKLREQAGPEGEAAGLIEYRRAGSAEPRPSDYRRVAVGDRPGGPVETTTLGELLPMASELPA